MPYYAKNQIVWAKVKGYPWWPAIVAKSNQGRGGTIEDEVLVNFVGENSHATLRMDKIADFEEEYEMHSNTKSKKLIDSIKIAKRITDGETTYEQEKEKMLRRLLKEDSDDSESDKEPRKTRAERSKEAEKNKTKATGRIAAKGKEKEPQSGKASEDLKDLGSQRFTRSTSKHSNVEMLTEPLIYNSRKGQASTLQKTRGSLKRGNTRLVIEKLRARREASQSGGKIESRTVTTRLTITKEKLKSPGKRGNNRRRMQKQDEEDNGENGEEGDDEENNSDQEEEKGDKNKKKAETTRRGGRVTRSSVTKKSTPQKNDRSKGKEAEKDMELEEMLKDVDEDEDDFELNSDDDLEKEVKTSNGKRALNHKSSPQYLRGKKGLTSDKEHIMKKLKTGKAIDHSPMNGPSDSTGLYANSSTKTVVAYNSLKLKRFEEDLEDILNKLVSRFQKKERLSEETEEVVQLLNIVRDIETNSMTGEDFINSEVAKILKTIQYISNRNKDLLLLADNLISAIDSVLKRIQDRILQFVMDNSSYMENLNLSDISKEDQKQNVNNSAISSEETRTKLEDHNSESDHHILDLHENTLMPGRMEEEDRHDSPNKMQMSMPSMLKDDSINTTFCKAESNAGQGKTEGGQKNINNYELRKKICQKFAGLLQRVYSMEKGKSQSLTLSIEDKINGFHTTTVNEYKKAIKGLLKLIKSNKMQTEELDQIQNMEITEFTSMLKQKLETIINAPESPENSVSTGPEKKGNATRERSEWDTKEISKDIKEGARRDELDDEN